MCFVHKKQQQRRALSNANDQIRISHESCSSHFCRQHRKWEAENFYNLKFTKKNAITIALFVIYSCSLLPFGCLILNLKKKMKKVAVHEFHCRRCRGEHQACKMRKWEEKKNAATSDNFFAIKVEIAEFFNFLSLLLRAQLLQPLHTSHFTSFLFPALNPRVLVVGSWDERDLAYKKLHPCGKDCF